jgi:glycosyltransferase involved in cell wall biosynthesis
VRVVANGVDPRRFSDASVQPRTRDRFVVGFVGTLKPWHGLSTLIDAFARILTTIPDAHLLIVGDGPERDAIERTIAERRLAPRVTLTGAVPHDAVPSFLHDMDVAVAPYPRLDDFYFSPLKLTEYMAAGLPVVASAIGQVTSLVRHEDTGLLFTPGDVTGLARALQRLHADAALRECLGQSARAFVAEHCTWRSIFDRILLLAGASVAPPDGAATLGHLETSTMGGNP